MDWRAARAVMAVVVLGGSGAMRIEPGGDVEPVVSAPDDPARPASGEPCAAVVIHDARDRARLVCDGGLVEVLASLCGPLGPVHRGDRLRPTPRGGRCRLAVEPLPAAHRLRLGLRLDVNEETLGDLTRVKGIGPRTAQRIVQGRPWASIDALDEVRGIGPERLRRIAPRLRAAPRPRLWPSRPQHAASSPRRP